MESKSQTRPAGILFLYPHLATRHFYCRKVKMATLIEDFEQQYAVLTADITAKIGKIASYHGGDRISLVLDVERQVEEAKELLEQMELEVREAEASIRPRLKTRLDSYRAELGRLSQEFVKVRSPSHQDGFGGSGDDNYGSELGMREEQKLRLLDNSERIERTGNHLTSGYRIMLESEQIGTQVLQDLHSQRETIQKSRSRLRETDADLGRSSRLIGGMIMRSMQQRLVLFGVALVFIIFIIVGIYFSFTKT